MLLPHFSNRTLDSISHVLIAYQKIWNNQKFCLVSFKKFVLTKYVTLIQLGSFSPYSDNCGDNYNHIFMRERVSLNRVSRR